MRLSILGRIFSLLLLLLLTSFVAAQDSGDEDLEAAFDLKIKAEKVGDYEEVVKLCKSALEKGLDEEGEKEAKTLAASALYEQAEQLMIRLRRQRDPTYFRNEAIKKLKEAVELDPELGEGWLAITRLNMIRGGDPDQARSAVDEAIDQLDQQPEKQSEAYYFRSILGQKDDKEQARDDLDKSLEVNGSNLRALQIRTRILIVEGEVDEGIEDSEKILEINDGNVDVWIAQGAELSRLALLKDALVARLKNRSDDEEDVVDDSGLPRQSEEELQADATKIRESVLDIYTRLVDLAPENEQVHLLKAEAHRVLEQDEEAIATIDNLIEKDDRSINALLMKAQLLLADESNDEDAAKVLDKALKLDQHNIRTRDLRMRFFMSRQQFPKAIREAKKILEREPNSLQVMQDLALLYSLTDKPEKAIEVYGGVLSKFPSGMANQLPPRERSMVFGRRIDTLRSRGDAYLSTGEHENAIEDYDEALDLSDQIEEMQASISDGSIRFTPSDGVLNNLAWVLATSTSEDLRNGKRSIELATRACEVTEYKAPHILSTLASGYAEEGDFEEAIKWIEKGLEVNEERDVTDEERTRQRESLEKELKHYRQNKPWRENQAEEDAAKKEAEAKKKEEDSDDEDSDDEDSEEDEDDDDDEDDDEDK